MVHWEQYWFMEFHPSKCEVIRITKSSNPITRDYFQHGHRLQVVSSAKYLGINMTNDLTGSTHITHVTNKAGKVLGLLKGNIKISSPILKEKAYQFPVRPLLDYSAATRDTHLQKDIKKVEMVQCRASRWTLNRYHNKSSITSMLDHPA